MNWERMCAPGCGLLSMLLNPSDLHYLEAGLTAGGTRIPVGIEPVIVRCLQSMQVLDGLSCNCYIACLC